MPVRILIDHCPVDCLTHDEALNTLTAALNGAGPLLVAPANAYTVVEAASNRALRDALGAMNLIVPDGFYIQWAARLLHRRTTHHVPTVPLTLALLEQLARHGGRVYLLGARAETVRAAAAHLARRYPGIVIAGARDGYFSDDEAAEVFAAACRTLPDLLLIGISSPRRELLLARHRDVITAPVTIGVGGMIDILGGKTPAGPDWLRRCGMMWLYRLCQEPRRLWRRYTVINSLFILRVLRRALAGVPPQCSSPSVSEGIETWTTPVNVKDRNGAKP